MLPSDYETYSLYSTRMFAIVRRYTPTVEEYSIDECFAELTGLRRPLRMSYGEIAQSIKHDLDSELGITFSLGLERWSPEFGQCVKVESLNLMKEDHPHE